MVLTEPEEVVVHAQLDKDAELDNANVTMTAMKETVAMLSNLMVPTSDFAPKDLVEHVPLVSLAGVLEDAQLKHPVTLLSQSLIVTPDVHCLQAHRSLFHHLHQATLKQSLFWEELHSTGPLPVWEHSHSNQLLKGTWLTPSLSH